MDAHRRVHHFDRPTQYGPRSREEPVSLIAPHPGCPYCCSADVVRLFLAPTHLDVCRCHDCGAAWEEDAGSHEVTGRPTRDSVLLPDDRGPHVLAGQPVG
jgi:hypothetical protein